MIARIIEGSVRNRLFVLLIAALVSLRQMLPGLLALLRLQAMLITLMGTAAGISIDRPKGRTAPKG